MVQRKVGRAVVLVTYARQTFVESFVQRAQDPMSQRGCLLDNRMAWHALRPLHYHFAIGALEFPKKRAHLFEVQALALQQRVCDARHKVSVSLDQRDSLIQES